MISLINLLNSVILLLVVTTSKEGDCTACLKKIAFWNDSLFFYDFQKYHRPFHLQGDSCFVFCLKALSVVQGNIKKL